MYRRAKEELDARYNYEHSKMTSEDRVCCLVFYYHLTAEHKYHVKVKFSHTRYWVLESSPILVTERWAQS